MKIYLSAIYRRIGLITLLYCGLSSLPSSSLTQPRFSTAGREFYIAFAANEGGETPPTQNVMDLYLMSRTPSRVTIEVPALSFFQTTSTQPGKLTVIHLPSGNNNGPTVELDTPGLGSSVHVTADHNICVIGVNSKLYSGDAFVAYPVAVCGNSYRAVSYKPSVFPGITQYPGEFVVAATQNNTSITTSGGQSILLSAGQAYLVQSGLDSTSDLTGTLITSDKPIAVFSGHERTEIPAGAVTPSGSTSRNHLIEQLLPTDLVDTSAVVIPFAGSSLPDLVRVIPVRTTPTIVSYSDGRHLDTVGVGSFAEITALTAPLWIHADQPIQVAQYMHTGIASGTTNGDPCLAIASAPSRADTILTVVSIPESAYSEHHINLACHKSSAAFMIDGTLITEVLHPIPNSEYYYTQITLTPGLHTIVGSDPFVGVTYGLGPVDAYAYGGGLTSIEDPTPSSVAENLHAANIAISPNPVQFSVSQSITLTTRDFGDVPIHATIADVSGTLNRECEVVAMGEGRYQVELLHMMMPGVYLFEFTSPNSSLRLRNKLIVLPR